MIKKKLEREIKNIIQQTLGRENVDFILDHPASASFGDFSSNIAIRISKSLGQSPLIIAKGIIEKIYKSEKFKDLGVEKIESAGPGFINFYLKMDTFLKEIREILSLKQNYGSGEGLQSKKIMVEYTDPNPFKEFHVGHLYSNIVGESICRLLESQGALVWRVNYQGDVGLHVAKSLWGMLQLSPETPKDEAPLSEKAAFMGRSYALGASSFEEEGLAKMEITALNKKIYERDGSVLTLWEKGKRWSLDYFELIYQRLSTNYGKTPAFNRYYPESESGEAGMGLVNRGLAEGIFEKGEAGAVIFSGEKYGLHTRVFINSVGLPTYEAKELGLAPTKYSDFPYDESIIVTGNEINEYFKVLLKALSLVEPKLGAKTKHISHGMVRLPEGKMSSRTGKIVRGEWLLNEAKNGAREKIKETVKFRSDESVNVDEIAESVGVGAVKYALIRSALGQDIAFSFKESIKFEGNSGPYLQYTYARAKSVLRKSSARHAELSVAKHLDPSVRIPQDDGVGVSDLMLEELSLLHTLYKFPEVVESAALQYSPHLLCNFLFDLSQKFNLFYNNVSILTPGVDGLDSESQEGVINLRLALTAATAQVIKNGLYLLGIDAPERM